MNEREVLKMKKYLVFDMDGTIADFYGVANWLDYLKAQDTTPYDIANPLYDTEELNALLTLLKRKGWQVIVTSWLAKDSTKEYKKAVRKAKREWLARHNFPFDKIHLVQYGTEKSTCTKKLGGYQILFDDSEEVRKKWKNGAVVNANENIIPTLYNLLRV